MRPLSLAALTVLELSPVQAVRCAAEAGYTHVGLRLVPATPTEPQWDAVGDTPPVREAAAALRDTGVQVLDIEILRLKPDTVVADFRPVLETGARLGAKHVLVAGNDPDEARLVERLAELADLCAPLGLAPAVEPMPWTDVRDLAQGLRVVEGARRTDVGLLVDPIHFDRAGDTPEALRAVDPARLPYLQFCDAPAQRPDTLDELLRQARAERQLPGEGGLDLAALLRAVPRTRALSLEMPLQSRGAGLDAYGRAALVHRTTSAWLRAHALD